MNLFVNKELTPFSKKLYLRCSPEFIFFKAQTGCPVDTMLRRTRWISDKTSDKTFFEENQQDIKSLCGSYNNLELLYLDKYQT